jgi:DNA-binding NarL/FixJ family response regulator
MATSRCRVDAGESAVLLAIVRDVLTGGESGMSQTVVTTMSGVDQPPVQLPTVSVVSRFDAMPASLTRFAPRVVTDDLGRVSATDDVVILHCDRSAPEITELHRLLGRQCPPVLVLSRVFDAQDVAEAFDNGVTSYLVINELPEFCLVDAAVRTAEGQSVLSPSAVTVLMSRLRESVAPPVDPAPQPSPAEELSPRECQVMELLVAGHTVTEIASHLRLTGKTIRNNLSTIYAKLNVRRQSEAILLWLGHQRRPGEPRCYNEPRFVPQLSPLRRG